MTENEWLAAFAAQVGITPPDAATVEQLLALAATAAHQSERTAAPIACYLVGLVGLDLGRANDLAAAVNPAAEGAR